jgi:LasA protease
VGAGRHPTGTLRSGVALGDVFPEAHFERERAHDLKRGEESFDLGRLQPGPRQLLRADRLVGNYPMSSLDMSVGGGWGSNQNGVRVSTSASGTFKRHSSCFAEVVHSGGWSTTYYHMMNLQYATNAVVGQSVFIGNPANTQAQALCNGGSSTGPHQHWSLKYNGSHYHLNQVTLSRFLITATGSSYDTNCNRFYLVKNGQKYCSGYIVNNP